MLRHRLVTGDVLARCFLRNRGRSGFRNRDPAAQLRTIDERRLCGGDRRHQQREGYSSEKSDAFHDDPAFLKRSLTTGRAHARRERSAAGSYTRRTSGGAGMPGLNLPSRAMDAYAVEVGPGTVILTAGSGCTVWRTGRASSRMNGSSVTRA